MSKGLSIKRQTKCYAVIPEPDLKEALRLLGIPEGVDLTVTVRCDRGEIPLDDKASLVVTWVEQQ